MTLEEAKEKALKLQHLVYKNPYEPFKRKLVEVTAAPTNIDAFMGFLTAKFRYQLSNEELLKQSQETDFTIYGFFERDSEYSNYDVRTLKYIIQNNTGWTEINVLSASDY